jgi:FkbM family methyltransferase
MSAWSRFYRGRHALWPGLYEAASLQYAPGIHMELVPGDIISDSIAFTGVYELTLTRRLARLARQGGTLVEVGANLGYFALLWAAANPKNKCVAFEASPRNIDLFKRNVQRNNFESQIELHAVAAGKEEGRLKFDTGPSDQTGWGGFARPDSPASIEVDVVRIDEVLAAAPIAVLKVDVEGADAWALIGCERLLKAGLVREIWYEQNKPRMDSLGIDQNAAQDFLLSVGYQPHPMNDLSLEVVEWSAVANSSRV